MSSIKQSVKAGSKIIVCICRVYLSTDVKYSLRKTEISNRDEAELRTTCDTKLKSNKEKNQILEKTYKKAFLSEKLIKIALKSPKNPEQIL